MKPIYMLAALLLISSACKKKEEAKPSFPTYTEPDFALIPVKDATWYVHLQGHSWSGNPLDEDSWLFGYNPNVKAGELDTSVHVYAVAHATGKDTTIYGNHYFLFTCKAWVTSTVDTAFRWQLMNPSSFYLRVDTLGQRVYELHDTYQGKVYEQLVIDFSTDEDNKPVQPFSKLREMNVIPDNEQITSSGYRLKKWKLQNIYNPNVQYFYKAVGVGGPFAIFDKLNICPHNAQTRSVAFVYKGDSTHFEYPLIE